MEARTSQQVVMATRKDGGGRFYQPIMWHAGFDVDGRLDKLRAKAVKDLYQLAADGGVEPGDLTEPHWFPVREE